VLAGLVYYWSFWIGQFFRFVFQEGSARGREIPIVARILLGFVLPSMLLLPLLFFQTQGPEAKTRPG